MQAKKINKQDVFILIVLFGINFIEMILEMAASRVLMPYFGNSQYVWTAIIGIIMLAGATGNITGGKISEYIEHKKMVAYMFLFAALAISVIPVLAPRIAKANADLPVVSGALLLSVYLFFLPSLFLSCITPVVLDDYISQKDGGVRQGVSHAAIGIGALSGTFFGGFFIVPALGVRRTLFVLSIAAICLAVITVLEEKKYKLLLSPSLVLAFILILQNGLFSYTNSQVIAEFDSEYSHITVEEWDSYGEIKEPVRLYRSAGAYSSGAYIDKNKKYDLLFEYTKKYDEALSGPDVSDDILMIGGAAYSYPKHIISNYPNKRIDVVEIDPMAEKIAKKYFYLDDLIEEYDAINSGRLGLFSEDGRIYLQRTEKKYSAILNDAFSGGIPVGSLSTDEAVKTIKNHLEKDGVYAANILASLGGKSSQFLLSELKVLENNFLHVYVIPVRTTNEDEYQNIMVFASDRELNLPESINWEYKGNEIYLTDDNCPVDKMVKTDYYD